MNKIPRVGHDGQSKGTLTEGVQKGQNFQYSQVPTKPAEPKPIPQSSNSK